MKRILLITLISLIISVSAYSQISSEIASYVDSTEILVQKGRKMMFIELNANNIVKAKDIFDYLTEKTKDSPYKAFYYIEYLYMNMLAGDWEDVEKYFYEYDTWRSGIVYQNTQELISKMYNLISADRENILKDCNNSPLDDQSKALVELILTYIKEGRSNLEYNEELAAYKKHYDNLKYESFEKNFLPKKYIKAAWNYSMGPGMIFTTADLAKNFRNNVCGTMAMDFNIDKFYGSLFLNGTGLKLKIPFDVSSGTEILSFRKDESFQYMDAGLKTGYFLIRNDHFQLAPFLSVSGSSLKSNRYKDPDDEDLEYRIFNSFTFGPGLHSEVKIWEYQQSQYSYYGSAPGYISLKLDGGYSNIVSFKDQFCKGNTAYLTLAVVVGIGDF